MDFVEICNICTRNEIIKAAKRIFNSDKICHSYCDFYFGVTFLEHSVVRQTSQFLSILLYDAQSAIIDEKEILCDLLDFTVESGL